MPSKDTTNLEILQKQSRIEELKSLINEERQNNERLRQEAELKIQMIKKLEYELSNEVEGYYDRKTNMEIKRKLLQDETNEKLV